MKKGFLLSKSNNPTPKGRKSRPNPNLKPSRNAPEAIPDRLSSLPEPILVHIISLLPTDDMVRTSVLARRWAHLWTLTPVLHFTRNFTGQFDLDLYPSIVDRCLSQCSSSSKLRSLRFPLTKGPAFPLSLDRWIRFSAAHSVEDLSLAPIFLGRGSIEMPPSLFDCCSLTALRISSCFLPSVSSGFPSLCTLVLTSVVINDASLEALLSSSPLLEELSLSNLKGITGLIVVGSTRLRHLMVYGCDSLERVEFAGAAPDLRRFMYCGDVSKIFGGLSAFEKADEVALLSTVREPLKNSLRWKELVASVANAGILSVNSWFFKFPHDDHLGSGDQPIVFKNLKELHWWPVYKKFPRLPAEPWRAERISAVSLRSLFSLLKDCPSLEQLCLLSTYYLEHENDLIGIPRRSSNSVRGLSFPEFDGVGYELPSLKTVRITEFSGSNGEMKLVEFVMNKAPALATVSLYYVGEVSEEVEGLRRKLGDFHQVASPHVNISLTEFDEDKTCTKHEFMWYEHMIM